MRSMEPILSKSVSRFTLFPIKDRELYDFYKEHVASFWTFEEVDLSEDKKHWADGRLSSDDKHFVKHVLAFFAASDAIVMENVSCNFAVEIQVPEARMFYAMQNMSEAIHSETYSMLIDTLVEPSEKGALFDAIRTHPSIKLKADWAIEWMAEDRPFAQRLFAFACVEGIFFSGSFCAVFWLKKRGLMPGLTFSNELISRDEGLHRNFAIAMQKRLVEPIAENIAATIVRDAVKIEQQFITESLPVHLIGMNAQAMSGYIEYVADHLMVSSGFQKLYGTENPFDFMENISLQGKTNFFERRVGEYAKAGVKSGSCHEFSIAEDF